MISSASGFSIGSSDAIDERFVLSKAQMPSINENVYPDVYFAVCKDDGCLYIFNKTNDVDTTYGKFRKVGSFSDFEETTTIDKLNNMLISQSGSWKQISMENALKGLSVSDLDGNTGLPVSDIGIKNAMGTANGLATLDNTGKLLASQLPTSAREIVGYLDASVDHNLPDESLYDNGNEIIITASGYIDQATFFILGAGNKLTNLEVAEANTLITNGYVFTLKSGSTVLGVVATFHTYNVVLQDGTIISLPYESDLSATSTPATVQVIVNEGDSMMLIDKHWIHLGNTTGVTSVNNKTGVVTLHASDISDVLGDSDIVTDWEDTTSDLKVPSEKLVKESLDSIESKEALTVYVDQANGSDDNDGLTETTPIKELATILTKYNLSQYFKLFIVIMSDITYTEFTNISISGVSSINIYSYGCSSTYTTDYSKNKKLTNVRFGLSMCRANVNNLDFEGDTYAKADNSLTFYDSSFFRVSMCRFTYTGTSYSDTRGVGIQSSRGDIERCVFTGINYVFYMSYNSDIMVRRNTFDETSEVYMTNASVIRYLNVDYLYMITNGTLNEDSIVYMSDCTIYINKTLIPTSANKETWTFTLSDGSTVTKNVVVL